MRSAGLVGRPRIRSARRDSWPAATGAEQRRRTGAPRGPAEHERQPGGERGERDVGEHDADRERDQREPREIRGTRVATRPSAMCATASAASQRSPFTKSQPASASTAASSASSAAASQRARPRLGADDDGVQAAAVGLEAERQRRGQRAEAGERRASRRRRQASTCRVDRDEGEPASASSAARRARPRRGVRDGEEREPPSVAPSTAGAQSAPSRPSQPISGASQRVASEVASGAGRERAEQRDVVRDELIDRAGDDERAEEPGDADRRRGERGLVAVLVLAQPDAGAEQPGERTPASAVRAPSPSQPARDRDREQEREAGEDGDAAEPRQHAATEDVLEVAPGGGGAARGRRWRGARRRRRGGVARPGGGRPVPPARGSVGRSTRAGALGGRRGGAYSAEARARRAALQARAPCPELAATRVLRVRRCGPRPCSLPLLTIGR